MSRILIIDDDSFVHRMAGFMFKKAGHEAECVLSGEEGIDRLSALAKENSLPAMVFIDNEMPGMSGIETIEKIRQTGDISGVNICLMTGTLTAELEESAQALGAVGCISKPLEIKSVTGILAKAGI